MRAGRDAHACAVGIESVAGDDARHVGAVSVIVIRDGATVDEIDELGDTLRAAAATQVVVPRCHSRVDDGDPDPRPVVAELLTDGLGSNRATGSFQRAYSRSIECDM